MKFYFMPLNIFGDIQKKNVGFRNVEKSSFSTPPFWGSKNTPFGGGPKKGQKTPKMPFSGVSNFCYTPSIPSRQFIYCLVVRHPPFRGVFRPILTPPGGGILTPPGGVPAFSVSVYFDIFDICEMRFHFLQSRQM